MTTLRALRVMSGRSTSELAREIGAHQPDLSEIERLKLKPSKSVAAKLEAKFGLPIDTLLAEAGATLAVRE